MGKNPLDILKSLAEEEDKFLRSEFVSPVFRNRMVATTIKGLVYTLNIPETKIGWHKFRPLDFERAKRSGEAGFDEISSYLSRLPTIRLITAYRADNVYFSVPLKNNNVGLDCTKLYPVFLTDDSILDFEIIICRFDGANIWFELSDPKSDLVKGDYLRDSFGKMLKVSDIRFKGLSFEEKAAYAIKFEMDKELKKKLQKRGIEDAIAHAGGELVSYRERVDSYAVTYTVDGQEYTSYVSKDRSHSIISAGICLSGEDSKFDLKSLVDVVREGQRKRLIHRTR